MVFSTVAYTRIIAKRATLDMFSLWHLPRDWSLRKLTVSCMDTVLLYNMLLRIFIWPCTGPLNRRSSAARLLRLWVRMVPVAWMSVCCECCVLSGRGLCDELITRPVGSYRLWCVVMCDLETSWMRGPWPVGGGGLSRQEHFHLIRLIFCFTYRPHVCGSLEAAGTDKYSLFRAVNALRQLTSAQRGGPLLPCF